MNLQTHKNVAVEAETLQKKAQPTDSGLAGFTCLSQTYKNAFWTRG